MKELLIRWQRLLDQSNQTCPRCGSTGTAVERAAEMLTRALRELEIAVVLRTESLDQETFARDPLESNRIWIGGLPLEWWLSASSGKSQCCSACGDEECRTVTIDGRTYEAIPAELIVKAGLLAAARLFTPGPECADGSDETREPPRGPVLPTNRCGCG